MKQLEVELGTAYIFVIDFLSNMTAIIILHEYKKNAHIFCRQNKFKFSAQIFRA